MLRPGGVLIGSDSLASNGLHHFHAGDTYNPVEPASLLVRLQALGFGKITIAVDDVLTFTAHRPRQAPGGAARMVRGRKRGSTGMSSDTTRLRAAVTGLVGWTAARKNCCWPCRWR